MTNREKAIAAAVLTVNLSVGGFLLSRSELPLSNEHSATSAALAPEANPVAVAMVREVRARPED